MSDEPETIEEPGDESPGPAETDATNTAKDLPIAVVVIGLTIAVLVFGAIGVKRYRALRLETMREFAREGRQSFEAGRAEAHRIAAERGAEETAEEAANIVATDSGEEAAPASPAVTQTAPSGP